MSACTYFANSFQGDWILDLCCMKREISLAAQKSGRNALVKTYLTRKFIRLVKYAVKFLAPFKSKNLRLLNT